VADELERRWAGGADALDAICYYSLVPTGKLFRPILLLDSAQAVGGDPMAVLPAAAGAECGHVASLIHDDIIDQDDLRPGRPSVQSKYGINDAIVAGDALIFDLFASLAECRRTGVPDSRVARALGAVAHAGLDLCRGQSLAAELTASRRFDAATYIQVAILKTAAFFRGACESGAVLGGGSSERARIRLLAYTYDGRSPSQLRNCVLPYLLDLYEATHLTVHLGVWSGGRVLIVENLHGRTAAMTFAEAGSLVPAPCTALGRVLLAHAGEYARLRALRGGLRSYTAETMVSPVLLAREPEGVHRLGVARTANQFLPGMTEVAAPIVDANRSVVAAVSVSGPTGHFDGEGVSRLVRHAAQEASLSPCLGGASPPVRRLERPDGALQYV
jgi:DNA-binding IclR family transcriptional regulator